MCSTAKYKGEAFQIYAKYAVNFISIVCYLQKQEFTFLFLISIRQESQKKFNTYTIVTKKKTGQRK